MSKKKSKVAPKTEEFITLNRADLGNLLKTIGSSLTQNEVHEESIVKKKAKKKRSNTNSYFTREIEVNSNVKKMFMSLYNNGTPPPLKHSKVINGVAFTNYLDVKSALFFYVKTYDLDRGDKIIVDREFGEIIGLDFLSECYQKGVFKKGEDYYYLRKKGVGIINLLATEIIKRE